MPHYSISIHSYSGDKVPKSFSGNNKEKVILTYQEYVKDKEENYCDDCYLKVSKDGIEVTSHERCPQEALKECCNQLYQSPKEIEFSNMVVIDSDEVEVEGDDIDASEETKNEDEEEYDKEPDTDEIPDDMKINGDAVSKDWDGYED